MKRTKLNFNLSSLNSPFGLAQGRQLSTCKGFTLIELLIVIVIIGVLATVFLANFIGVRQRARDSQRKSDLRQIQAALELIRSNTDSYPASLYSANCPASSPLQAGTPAVTYMKKIPCDPKGTNYYSSGNYLYRSSDDGISYVLCACLENTNDSQGATNIACSFFVTPACNAATGGSGKYFFLVGQ